MALELLRYQPTADGREGWRAHISELIAIANEDPALGGA
jgi:predicted secreted protein